MKTLRTFASSVVGSKLPMSTPPPVRIIDPEQQRSILPPESALPSGAAGAVPENIAAPAPMQAKPQRIPSLKAGVKLTEDQKQFTAFIEKNKGVGISASPVGSGKTLSMLAAALNLRAKGQAGKAIVLVPSGLRTNFEQEGVKKFTNAKVGIIGTKDEIASNPKMDVTKMGDKDFYVVSYDMFKQNPKAYLEATGADTVIADEMHRAKDPSTELARTIREIRPHIKNFVSKG